MIRSLPRQRHRWPDGAWSPEIPFPATGSDLSELTEVSQGIAIELIVAK
jgi:hypothetical protein